MNEIIITETLKNKKYEWFFDKLLVIDSDFLLDNDFFNTINDIDIYNRRTVTYIVYQIILNNDLKPNILQKPNGGFSFRDKVNKKYGPSLGIYHVHLENEMVLLWYVEKRLDGELYLNIDYFKHPNNYIDQLRNIYKSNYGFNIENNTYFKNNISNTYLKENRYILFFKNFLSKIK